MSSSFREAWGVHRSIPTLSNHHHKILVPHLIIHLCGRLLLLRYFGPLFVLGTLVYLQWFFTPTLILRILAFDLIGAVLKLGSDSSTMSLIQNFLIIVNERGPSHAMPSEIQSAFNESFDGVVGDCESDGVESSLHVKRMNMNIDTASHWARRKEQLRHHQHTSITSYILPSSTSLSSAPTTSITSAAFPSYSHSYQRRIGAHITFSFHSHAWQSTHISAHHSTHSSFLSLSTTAQGATCLEWCAR